MQLSLILSENLSLAEEFSIFRFDKLISDEIYNFNDEKSNNDISSTIAFDQYSQKCINHIN